MLGDELDAAHEIGHLIKVVELGHFFMSVELTDNSGGGTRYDAKHIGDPIPVLDEIKIYTWLGTSASAMVRGPPRPWRGSKRTLTAAGIESIYMSSWVNIMISSCLTWPRNSPSTAKVWTVPLSSYLTCSQTRSLSAGSSTVMRSRKSCVAISIRRIIMRTCPKCGAQCEPKILKSGRVHDYSCTDCKRKAVHARRCTHECHARRNAVLREQRRQARAIRVTILGRDIELPPVDEATRRSLGISVAEYKRRHRYVLCHRTS